MLTTGLLLPYTQPTPPRMRNSQELPGGPTHNQFFLDPSAEPSALSSSP